MNINQFLNPLHLLASDQCSTNGPYRIVVVLHRVERLGAFTAGGSQSAFAVS